MNTLSETNAISEKTRELCQTILEQPEMKSIRQRIENFMGDAGTRSEYESLVNKGQALQQKQQASVQLTGDGQCTHVEWAE